LKICLLWQRKRIEVFDARIFADMTRRWQRLDASEFDRVEGDYLSLIEAVERWRNSLLSLAREQERGMGLSGD